MVLELMDSFQESSIVPGVLLASSTKSELLKAAENRSYAGMRMKPTVH